MRGRSSVWGTFVVAMAFAACSSGSNPPPDGSIMGGVTLRHFDPMRGVIEVGYWLFEGARGRGLGTLAVRAVAREAFASGISRLEANVRIGNDASERVLERAGFTREGVKRRLLRHGDGRADATLFSLLPGE